MKTPIESKAKQYVKVNEYAYIDDTWLAPYFLFEFEAVRITKNFVWFLMDVGYEKMEVKKYSRKVFDILPSPPKTT